MKSVSNEFLIYHFKESDEDNIQREEQRAGPLTVPQQVRKKKLQDYTTSPLSLSHCPFIILFRDAMIHFFQFWSDCGISTLFFLNNIIININITVVVGIMCIIYIIIIHIILYVTFFSWLLKSPYRRPGYKLTSSLHSYVVLCTPSLLYTDTLQCRRERCRVHRCLQVSSASLQLPIVARCRQSNIHSMN